MSNGAASTGKKSGGILKWLLLGCVGIIIIGAVVVAAGGFFVAKKVKEVAENPMGLIETIIELNPELEVVENDEGSQKITIKNTTTGQTQTFDWSEVKEGKIRFDGSEGTFEVNAKGEGGATVTQTNAEGEVSRTTIGVSGDLPPFFPEYPRVTETRVGFRTQSGGKLAGMFTFETGDSLQQLSQYYTTELERRGFVVEQQTYDVAGNQGANLTAKKEADGITLNLLMNKDDTTTGVTVTYSDDSP